MSDPLSEAREELRWIYNELAQGAGEINTTAAWERRLKATLARLDALPVPLALDSRDTVHIVDQPAYGPTRWGPGWFYPDVPADSQPHDPSDTTCP